MRKRILGLILALSAILALNVTPASAATNGNHHQSYVCTGGGTTTTVGLYYNLTGLGTSQENIGLETTVEWSTKPSALLNGITVWFVDSNNGTNPDLIGYIPGPGLNSVASSGIDNPTTHSFGWNEGVTPSIEVWVDGGVGNSTARCKVRHDLL